MGGFMPLFCRSRSFIVLLPACLALYAGGCFDEPFPFDTGSADAGDTGTLSDAFTGDTPNTAQQITYLSPDPAERPIIFGLYEVVFRYDDEAGRPATISVSYVRQSEIPPTILNVDAPGEYSIKMDTSKLVDGNESFLITAVSDDGRKVARKGKVLLDNNRPAIEILDPTPPEGAGFVDDLSIRVRVTDSGSLVHAVQISVGDFAWSWPADDPGAAGGDATTSVEWPAAEVDTRTVIDENAVTFQDLVIPTEAWRGGDVVLTVTASDGVVERDSVATLPLTFVEKPGLDSGETIDLDLPADTYIDDIEGIRLGPAEDGDWALMAAIRDRSGYRIDLFQMSTPGRLLRLSTVISDTCPLHRIVDMNLDGMDDILAWCGSGDSRRIVVLEQTVDRLFVETKTLRTAYMVKDIAAGNLNDDGVPDIAFVSNVEPLWTGIMLSTVDGYGDFAGYAAPSFYSGAVKPDHVAIGRFSDEEHGAVIVGATGSSTLTAYPVDESGVPSMGENSSLTPDDLAIDDVSVMASVNFAHRGGAHDSLVVADARNIPAMGVARLRQDDSRRVESVREWAIGYGASDIAIGDINADGSPDAAILCTGSHMVAVFPANPNGDFTRPLSEPEIILVGPATGITLVDMDMDGYLDIVLMMGNRQMKVIYRRQESTTGWFDASHQAIVPGAPMSVATGHFVKPLSGEGANFLDAAALYLYPNGFNVIAVYSSDPAVRQPTLPVGSVGLDVNSAIALRPGNFDVDLAVGGGTYLTRPDDLIVTTSETQSELKPAAARLVLFQEDTHSTLASRILNIKSGDAPMFAAVGEFDLGAGPTAAMDVAFLTREKNGDSMDRLIRVMLGNLEGKFSTTSEQAGPLKPLSIGMIMEPGQMKAYPLRRTLKRYLAGTLSQPDLMVINNRTKDVTLYLGMGFGLYKAREKGSHDFSPGGPPLDVSAGYLRGRIDDELDDEVAANQLPDLVTLINTHAVVDFSKDRKFLTATGEDVAFESPLALPVSGRGPVAVDVADMNMDGMYDIVVLDTETSTIEVFPNLGQRRFATPYVYSAGKKPVAMSIADVDGDGCPDVVTADREGWTLSTVHNATKACRDQR